MFKGCPGQLWPINLGTIGLAIGNRTTKHLLAWAVELEGVCLSLPIYSQGPLLDTAITRNWACISEYACYSSPGALELQKTHLWYFICYYPLLAYSTKYCRIKCWSFILYHPFLQVYKSMDITWQIYQLCSLIISHSFTAKSDPHLRKKCIPNCS